MPPQSVEQSLEEIRRLRTWGGGIITKMLANMESADDWETGRAVLADALEEAGCKIEGMVEHLRQPCSFGKVCSSILVLCRKK